MTEPQPLSAANPNRPPELALLSVETTISSVLPPPETLASYERTLPGAAERLLALVEREAEHRHALERDGLRADLQGARLGLLAGIVLSFGVTTASIAAVYQGKPVSGVIGIGATAALIGTAFRMRR